MYEYREYKATIIKHVDGDTSWLSVDLGVDVRIRLTVRWFGVNTAELPSEDAKAALAYVRKALPEGGTCVLHTIKDRREKYGRYLGVLYDTGDAAARGFVGSVNQALLDAGLAVAYPLPA